MAKPKEFIPNPKELSKKPELLECGHRMCPGCGAAIIARLALKSTEDPIVVANATGCLEVSTTIYPYTAWKVPWIHNAFENASATMSGVETAYRAFKKKKHALGKKEVKFIAFGGDGGTYDIGIQSLSAALERGHRFVYVCYDNEAYMNTGIQRSSSTPLGADTKTTPVGSASSGKTVNRKDLTAIMVAHNIPYVAQASLSNYVDFMKKMNKAFNADGPAFINILSPCIPGWGVKTDDTIPLSKAAVDTCFWPLFEVINGKYVINYDPGEKKKPVTEWLKGQKRFSHLFEPKNAELIKQIQQDVDKNWEKLKKLSIL